MNDLGPLVRSHPVDGGRRIGQGVGVTIAGALITLIAIPIAAAYIADANSPGFSPLPGVLLGLGLALLVLGLVRLVQSVLRPGERFDVHEAGLVHVTARRTRSVPWPQVGGVRELGRFRPDGPVHWLGVDYRCVVRVKDGGSVRFNTLVEDADQLTHAIRKRTT